VTFEHVLEQNQQLLNGEFASQTYWTSLKQTQLVPLSQCIHWFRNISLFNDL